MDISLVRYLIIYQYLLIKGMKGTIPLCPILTPTYKQFKNFEQYVNSLQDKYKKDYGMVKVFINVLKIIPPVQWKSRSQKYQQILKQLKIEKPEHQTLHAKSNHFFYCENGKTHQNIDLAFYRKGASQNQKEIQHIQEQSAIEQYVENDLFLVLENSKEYQQVEESLMDKTSGDWDFSHLTSMFSHAVKERLNGLNTTFLFIGAWRTFFNWHIQDLDLSAINLLHQGAPKVWYAVHPQDRMKFQAILKDIFPQMANTCSNFLRHKSIFFNPYKLKEKHPSLRISKMYQSQNQISLAFSQGYHCGFNMGFNIAEAVNYGSNNWLDKLSNFKGCQCKLNVGVQIESYVQIIKNITDSPIFKKVKNTPSFKKLQDIAIKEAKEDEEFEKLPKSYIYKQFLKVKTKKINKNVKEIYVPKFKRYFDHDYTQQKQVFQKLIQCDRCHKWQKINQQTCKRYQRVQFFCKQIGKTCIDRGIQNTRKLRSNKK